MQWHEEKYLILKSHEVLNTPNIQYIMCLNSPAPTYPENTNLPISKSGTSCSHMLHYLQLYIVNPVGMGVCKFFIVLVFFFFFFVLF